MIIDEKNKPKFIISKKRVFENYDMLFQISDLVSYSFKTNPIIGNILFEKEEENLFLSIHSINELNQVKNLNSKKIWFFGLAWNEDELEILFEKYNLENFVVDNLNDLNILLEFIKKNNKKINLLLRMKLKENTIFTGKHYVFGMYLKEIESVIDDLYLNSNIGKLGIHFHRKTQNVSEWSLKDEVVEVLGKKILNKINLINVGGGLPGKYKNSHDKTLLVIFDKLKELKKELNSYNIEVIIEPGRFIANSAVILKSKIIAIHNKNIFLNVSIFNGMLDTVVANVKLLVEGELERGEKYLLKGCTPDSSDILRYSVYLSKPKVGGKIVFLNCGAYTYQTNFCALDKIETEIVEKF